MRSKTEKTNPSDLNTLLKKLNEAGIEFILVDGLAAVVQGAPISTFDLVIVYLRTEENILKITSFLKSVNAFLRRPDDKILRPDKIDFKKKGRILLTTDYGPLDVLAFIEKGYGFEELISKTVEIEFQGYNVYVLSLDTIIDLKRESKDPKDHSCIAILEETLNQINENEKG
ncbi:MAG: hypothetical protein MUP22_02155 [Desulfobacterales bacterium]|nr:hypothetical protein [Desulfobacterales bacterium]